MSGILQVAANSLQNYEKAIGLVGQAVSSSDMIGGRGSEALFSSIVTGGGGSTSGATVNVVKSIDRTAPLKDSNSNLHVGIAGSGFMCARANSDGTGPICFTRDGSWYADQDGFLRSQTSGYILHGQLTDPSGKVTDPNSTSLSSLVPINVSSINQVATPTSKVHFGAKLPADAPAGYKQDMTISIIDSLGAEQPLICTWEKMAAKNEWKMEVKTENGKITRAKDSGGTPAITKDTNYLNVTADPTATPPVVAADNRMTVIFNEDGTPKSFDGLEEMPQIAIEWTGTTAQASNSTIDLNLGTIGSTDGVIFSGSDFYVSLKNQDGKPTGIPSGVQIDPDGTVSFIFSNGEQLKKYKLPLANFSNVNGLQEASGNLYTQTTTSGSPILNAPKTGGAGSIMAGKLEGSNVDTPEQFTKLIQYQQAYSANLNLIQTAKKMSDQLDSVMMR